MLRTARRRTLASMAIAAAPWPASRTSGSVTARISRSGNSVTARSVRWWSIVHRWSSLVTTAFLLLLCLTGLPLIFHHEIDEALGYAPRADILVSAQKVKIDT